MKKIALFIMAIACAGSCFGQAEDTTRYMKYDLSNVRYGSLWAKNYFRLPDTARAAQLPGNLAKNSLGTKLYLWDGTTWNQVSGGGVAAVSSVFGRTGAVVAQAGDYASYYWSLTGNSNTVAGTNFLGTTNDVPLEIRTNNIRRGYIGTTGENVFFSRYAGENISTGTGNVGIGLEALRNVTNGINNIAIGNQANNSMTAYVQTVTVGGLSSSVGDNAVAIGSSAQAGASATAIGSQASATGTGSVAIGASASVSEDNTIVIGADNAYRAMGTSTPDHSSILDITSPNRGFLAPRMNNDAMNEIASPAVGLLIFNTDQGKFYFYDGTGWNTVGNGSSTWQNTLSVTNGSILTQDNEIDQQDYNFGISGAGSHVNAATAFQLQPDNQLAKISMSDEDNGGGDLTIDVNSTRINSFNGDASVTSSMSMDHVTGEVAFNSSTQLYRFSPKSNVAPDNIAVFNNGNLETSTPQNLATALQPYLSTAPTGSAGGDLTGTYPNPTVAWSHGNATNDLRYLQLSGGTMTNDLILANAIPPTALSAAPKSYIDNLITGITWKGAVAFATTANITLSGSQTVDGIASGTGKRALVKNQTTTSENGVYITAAGAWTRATDVDAASEITDGTVLVTNGTINKNTQWTSSSTVTTVGTDPITYAQIAGAGTYVGDGTTIDLTGNVFGVKNGGVSNAKLANSSFTLNGSSVSLGGTRTLSLASSDFANQGTTTTVLHGNASGNPSWGAIVDGDITAGTISNSKLANSTISGISLGSNLANLTATDGTLTFSGTYTGATARTIGLNLGASNTWTASGAVSASAIIYNGSVYTGGSATTTTPFMLFNPSGTSAATNWSTSGTYFGMNAVNGYGGDFMKMMVNNNVKFTFSSAGSFTAAGNATISGTTATSVSFRNDANAFGTSSFDGLILSNTTSGTNGVPVQYSQRLRFTGNAYTGSTSQQADYYIELQPVNGTTPITSNLVFRSQINSGGYTTRATLTDDGKFGVSTAPTSTLHSGGSFAATYTASAVDITLTASHYTINLTVTGKTATLPTAVGITGRMYVIKLTASGTGTVATTSSQTIDGSTTYSLGSQYKYVTVQSDGANWIVIANN